MKSGLNCNSKSVPQLPAFFALIGISDLGSKLPQIV